MKLALGTAQFGLNYGIANRLGQVSIDEAETILRSARASGMDTIDTAIAYGDSELRLGEVGIQGLQVVSKLPPIPADCGDISLWVVNAVIGSLQRLKVEHLYGFLLHGPQQLLARNGSQLYRALQQLKSDAMVQRIGISINDPTQLDLLASQFPMDIVQAPLNVMDRRLIDSGWLPRLAEKGTELHVRSVFLQGLLLMKAEERPDRFARWQALWERWDAWLEEHRMRPLEACLAYALSFPQIARVIVGVDSAEQLSQILVASKTKPLELGPELGTRDTDLLNPSQWTQL